MCTCCEPMESRGLNLTDEIYSVDSHSQRAAVGNKAISNSTYSRYKWTKEAQNTSRVVWYQVVIQKFLEYR